jgi:hypothetical protein
VPFDQLSEERKKGESEKRNKVNIIYESINNSGKKFLIIIQNDKKRTKKLFFREMEI